MREYLLYIKESNSEAKSMISPCFALDKMFWEQQHGVHLHILGKSTSLSLIFLLRSLVNKVLGELSPQSQSHFLKPLSESVLIKIRSNIHRYIREVQKHALFTFFPLTTSYEGETSIRTSTQTVTRTSTQTSIDKSKQISTTEIPPDEFPPLAQISLVETEWRARELCRHLAGRALLLEEIEFISKLPRTMIIWMIQWLALAGRVEWLPGVLMQLRKGWIRHQLMFVCQRCGATDEEIKISSKCRSCGQACRYCSRCLQMGRSTCCTPYICMPLETPDTSYSTPTLLQWKGTFSTLQEESAKRAVVFVRDRNVSEFLIWAVCGAGKTELVFQVIDEVLSTGGKVLLATPRKDVVLELAPRLKQVFPAVSIRAVHGSSEEKWEDGQLIISTTHQVLRMYEAFRLVILDEVDAFPYHNNPMLYRAVSRAKAVDGKIIYLSATPPDYLRERLVGRSSLPFHSATHTLIPSRFHGHPIPVPEYLSIPNWNHKIARNIPMRSLLESIKDSLDNQRQVFIFVPRIADVAVVLSYLREYLPGYEEKMEGVYSSDQAREHKVLLFRQNKLRLLVTTTILERGVTIPRSDVFILGADCEIFDEASLVQIAGRVGRSADSPAGKVIFVVAMRSKQSRLAIKQIKEMNRLGQGLKQKVRDCCETR